jgi:hypothetical protein
LGDKVHEKVLDYIAKVDKAMIAAALDPSVPGVLGVAVGPQLGASLATSLGTTKAVALIGNPGVRQREEGLVQGCRHSLKM